MEQTPLPEPPGFADLTKAEQVRYLQALWDRIVANPGDLPVPEGHLVIAEGRLAEYQKNPDRERSAYEVIDRLAKKRR